MTDRDRIAEPWGTRTPYTEGSAWDSMYRAQALTAS